MSDVGETAPPAPPPPAPPQASRAANPVRKVALVVLLIGVVLFAYKVVADRVTPYSAQATVQAYVLKIAPEVAGRVVTLDVADNTHVSTGKVLLRIDPQPYRLKVKQSEAQLANAGQQVGALTSGVASAQAALTTIIAQRTGVREQADRIFQLVRKGIYAESRRTVAQSMLDQSEASVEKAQADLETARHNLGVSGPGNAQIREALANLQQAQLDLTRTTIRAPSEGVVTNLRLSPGDYLAVGADAMTFIDTRELWIEAAFRENTLEHMKIGDPVDVVLDIRPGRVFRARVQSIGFGVSAQETDPQTGLPVVRQPSGWIREPQPIPVRIVFERGEMPAGVRIGSQANVIVYTGRRPVMNAIAWLRIRLISLLTYVS